MGDESPRFDTTAIIRGFAASDDDALVEYMLRYKAKLVRRANRSLHKGLIDAADLDGEGAVDLAFGRLCQLRRRGVLDSIRDSEGPVKLMLQQVDWVIKDQKKHSEAARRGGRRGAVAAAAMDPQDDAVDLSPATQARHHRIELDLDQLASREWAVEDVVVTETDLEALLVRLPDDCHRTIVKMRCEGYSIEEIAHSLGVARRTIERRLRDIADVFLIHDSDS